MRTDLQEPEQPPFGVLVLWIVLVLVAWMLALYGIA